MLILPGVSIKHRRIYGRYQAIVWTNAGISFIGPFGTNISEILLEMYLFSFKKMQFKCR